jgi:2,3-bisphosphoglycerate-dependent phosphoglycerate mutase
VYTSVLTRAIRTADVVLDEIDRHWVPVLRSWRLNERHYGVLQGRRKADVVAEFGEELFRHWRRSLHGTPPPLPDDSPHSTVTDPRYAGLGAGVPRTESLARVGERLVPYWSDVIAPDVAEGRTVLVTSHSNALRALVKHLDDVSDADIATVNVPTGIPLVYTFTGRGKPDGPGRYLDPGTATVAAAAVASEGIGPSLR